MRRMIAMLLAAVFLISTGTSVYANDVSRNMTDAEKILEQMENMGFWEKDDVSVTRSATVLEYTRYDGEKTSVDISEVSGNEVVTFRSEGKVNTIIVTPDGEYYCDEVTEENMIEVNTVNTTVAEPRITTETWVTRTTPYDNGPYTYNRNMTKNMCIDLNQEVGSLALDTLLFILVPEVAVLKYFEMGLDRIDEFSTLSDLLSIMKGECPFCEFVFVREEYYNGDSDITGRPLEYCYEVHTKVAKTDSFNSFFETVDDLDAEISYAKQLIYA